ncbi:MAG: peptidylprolyl isomerase [Deltaproteobacteria bacterium]|nr:peptidylprolyl isomerase [Deltaproteobacteria bacterium]
MSGAVLGVLFFLTSASGPSASQPQQAITLKPASVIQDGSIVSIEYTLTDDAGAVLDSSVGKEPLTYIQGAGQIVGGLEREMNGLKVGDRKKVKVSPQDGYGVVSEKAFQEIPREKVPVEAQKAGASFLTRSGDGRVMPIRIREVRDRTVVVDLNHPLAGKTLHFDVTVKDIKAAETK